MKGSGAVGAVFFVVFFGWLYFDPQGLAAVAGTLWDNAAVLIEALSERFRDFFASLESITENPNEGEAGQ